MSIVEFQKTLRIFANKYSKIQLKDYVDIIEKMYKGLLDRDTSPGAEPEDLLKLNIRTLIIPGNDDAMGAIQLYAHGIAEAVIEGKASIQVVPEGDDEFVELDEEGTVGKSDIDF